MSAISIDEVRWDRITNTEDNAIVTMLRAMASRIERGDIDPAHVMICMGFVHEDGSTHTDFAQQGRLGAFAQLGLLTRISQKLFEVAE